jgi:hypothetical protein
MAFCVIQAGATLRLHSTSGVSTALTLPTNVTLSVDRAPRWLVYGRYVILVNTPSQPVTIDATGTVRLLCPRPPRIGSTLTGATAGALTGNNYKDKYTFITFDSHGNIISESDFSPISNAITIAAKKIKSANLDISPDSIGARRLYRNVTDGAVYFQWIDLDGNTATSIEDDLADAALSIVAAPILGTPPHLTLIAAFRGRIFGVGSEDIDNVRYTETGIQYAWPIDNTLPIQTIGSDVRGVTAFAPRRDALGVGRQNQLSQITGTGVENAAGDVDLDVVILTKELGIESQESVDVYRDTAYFIWKDGIYSWGSDGLTCLSDGTPDGRGNVRSWFTTNSYFNTARFQYAFGKVDPVRNKYRVWLATAGSSTENTWVEVDLKERTWWGPHVTAAFSPSCVFTFSQSFKIANVPQENNVLVNTVGSTAGDLYQEKEATSQSGDTVIATDGTSSGIVFDIVGKRHDGGDPDSTKVFGDLSMFGKAQAAGTLTVSALTGELNEASPVSQSYDMTQSRQRLAHIGVGKHAQLELTHSTAGEEVELYGYEINPVNIVGIR